MDYRKVGKFVMWINAILIAIGIFIASCEHLGYHIVIESDDPLMDKIEDVIEEKTGVKVDITYPARPNEQPE